MENNEDIARGYIKGDKVAKESLWLDLTEKLNSSGPPTKDCSGWKKTWADWKIHVKNKLSHNKQENFKTGGGQYNKYVLSNLEESVARVSGIYRSVEGIVGARDFAESDLNSLLNDESVEDQLDVTPSTSKSAQKNNSNDKDSTMPKRQHSPTPLPDPKRKRPNTPSSSNTNSKHDLNSLLNEENKCLGRIVKLMEDQKYDFRSLNRKVEKLCSIFESYFNDKAKREVEAQKLLKEKNEVKLKLLKVETLKLELEKRKCEPQQKHCHN